MIEHHVAHHRDDPVTCIREQRAGSGWCHRLQSIGHGLIPSCALPVPASNSPSHRIGDISLASMALSSALLCGVGSAIIQAVRKGMGGKGKRGCGVRRDAGIFRAA
jgi:hypothetical protein